MTVVKIVIRVGEVDSERNAMKGYEEINSPQEITVTKQIFHWFNSPVRQTQF